MASVNTSSIREEISNVKSQLDEQVRSGKVADETRLLISTLLMIIDMLMAIFLEKTTKKNSKNSSIPSSQTEKDESSIKPNRNLKSSTQNDEIFNNSRTVETQTIASVDQCSHCAENLSQVCVANYERRTRIDIVFEKRVEHIDAQIKHCPCCGQINKGRFPSDLSGPLQYGLGIKAYILNLLITQMISLNRVQMLLKTLIGQVMSEATMLKYIWQLHQALEAWEEDATEQLLASSVMHVDETSLRLNKKNYWIHVCSSGNITLKRFHAKRGAKAMDEINIIPRYGGVLVHDCWASYFSYPHADNALCGSHLLRELEFIINSNNYAWAKNIKRLLKQTCAKVSESQNKKLSDVEYANLQKRYRNILTRGRKELPPRPVRPSGKRGRLAQSDAQNLWDRLLEHEYAVLRFACRSEVPFTNNRAERDLRMSKVKQKISGCFRQEQYAIAYCRISSYLQSMAYQGYNPLVAIQLALAGNFTTAKG